MRHPCTESGTQQMNLVDNGTESRAGNMQRWAIAPPALDDDTEGLEELCYGGELEGPETIPPSSPVADPEVYVALPNGWQNEERDPRVTLTDEVAPPALPAATRESPDTIPAPPWLGDE